MASSAKKRAIGLDENPEDSENSSDDIPEDEDDSEEEDSEASEEEINEVKTEKETLSQGLASQKLVSSLVETAVCY